MMMSWLWKVMTGHGGSLAVIFKSQIHLSSDALLLLFNA